jgi:uncharacterized membrane protein YciS (DUF1049 family)
MSVLAEGKLVRRLCGTVLGMEAVVMLLTIVPTMELEHVRGGTAGGVGGGLAVIGLLLAGVVGRPRMSWALIAGSLYQVAVISAGLVLPAMYVLGVIFGALWITGIWLSRRIEQQVAERQALAQEQAFKQQSGAL